MYISHRCGTGKGISYVVMIEKVTRTLGGYAGSGMTFVYYYS